MSQKLKYILAILAAVIIPALTGSRVQAFTGSGAGTEASPYVITTAAQMYEVNNNLSAYYILGNDIDMTGSDRTGASAGIIGNWDNPFSGVFDGKEHSVKNLTISSSDSALKGVGLFGRTNNAVIRNVVLENVNITVTVSATITPPPIISTPYPPVSQYSDGLGGQTDADASGAQTDVDASGSLEDTYASGGQIDAETFAFPPIGNTVDIYCGGIVGYMTGGTVENCFAVNGAIKCSGSAGGIVGYMSGAASLKGSGAMSGLTVSGKNYNGGLVGYLYNTSASVAQEISVCRSEAVLTAATNMGGIVGRVQGTSGTVIKDCYSLSNIPKNTSSLSLISTYRAGLIGYCVGVQVKNSYWAGRFTGTGSVKGVLTGNSAAVVNCYFDSSLVGITTPAAQAKTTAQMKTAATYAGWDFSTVWAMNGISGYPAFIQYLMAPEQIVYTALTFNSVSIAWDVIPRATGYEVIYKKTAGGDAVSLTSSVNMLVINQLEPETSYEFTVKALSPGMTGRWSDAITVTTPKVPLPAPTGLIAFAKTFNSVTLSWNNVTEAEKYEISYAGEKILADTNSRTITSLAPDTEYIFRVKAMNEERDGFVSSPLTVRTLPGPYPAPTGFASTNVSHDSLILTWDEVEGALEYEVVYGENKVTATTNTIAITGLTPTTTYDFYVKVLDPNKDAYYSGPLTVTTLFPAPTGFKVTSPIRHTSISLGWDAVEWAEEYTVTYGGQERKTESNSITISGLAFGTTYDFSVKATGHGVDGLWSNTLSVTTRPPDYPAPTGLAATAVTSTYISLRWDPVPGATMYSVDYPGRSQQTISLIKTNSFSARGFEPGTAYEFRVWANDAGGTGSEAVITVTTLTVYPAPTGLVATNVAHNSVTLSWDAVAWAQGYEIAYGDMTAVSTRNSVTIEGLAPETTYEFTVKAVSSDTDGYWSEALTVTTARSPLPAPSGLRAADVTAYSVNLSWDAVAGAEGYEVAYGGVTIASPTNSVIIDGLEPETAYSFTVKALSADLGGFWSEPLSVTTLEDPGNNAEMVIQAVNGGDYSLAVTGDGIADFTGVTFTVTYDAAVLRMTDLAAQTAAADTNIGEIAGTDIQILSHSGGVITFKVNKASLAGKGFTGILTVLKFRAIAAGQTTVRFTRSGN